MAKVPSEPSSEITPEDVYLRRREFMKNAALFTGTAAAVGSGLVLLTGGTGAAADKKDVAAGDSKSAAPQPSTAPAGDPGALKVATAQNYAVGEEKTAFKDVTTY